jgi:hypothetical protein
MDQQLMQYLAVSAVILFMAVLVVSFIRNSYVKYKLEILGNGDEEPALEVVLVPAMAQEELGHG